MKNFNCCICGGTFAGYGNNPDPVIDIIKNPEARCCWECDGSVVIPTRMKKILNAN